MASTSCYKNDDFKPDNIEALLPMQSGFNPKTIAILGDLEKDKVFFVCRHSTVPQVFVKYQNEYMYPVTSSSTIISILGLENEDYVTMGVDGKFVFKGSGCGTVSYEMFGYKFEFGVFTPTPDSYYACMWTPEGDKWTAIYND